MHVSQDLRLFEAGEFGDITPANSCKLLQTPTTDSDAEAARYLSRFIDLGNLYAHKAAAQQTIPCTRGLKMRRRLAQPKYTKITAAKAQKSLAKFSGRCCWHVIDDRNRIDKRIGLPLFVSRFAKAVKGEIQYLFRETRLCMPRSSAPDAHTSTSTLPIRVRGCRRWPTCPGKGGDQSGGLPRHRSRGALLSGNPPGLGAS